MMQMDTIFQNELPDGATIAEYDGQKFVCWDFFETLDAAQREQSILDEGGVRSKVVPLDLGYMVWVNHPLLV